MFPPPSVGRRERAKKSETCGRAHALAFSSRMAYNIHMYKILRIVCCVVSAMLLAACVFIFIFCGMAWGIICLLAAACFFGLTLFFKDRQEKREGKDAPAPHGDFITGKPEADDRRDDANR